MNRAPRFLTLFLLLFGMAAQAKTPPPIHFTARVSPAPVHPGEIATVTVSATVDPGWHVYSVVPAPNGPSATEIISLYDGPSWHPLGPTTEDAPIRKRDPNFNLEVGYHEGRTTFQRQFRVPADLLAHSSYPILEISGPVYLTIHYQTCNASVCLPPTDTEIAPSVTIVPGPVRPAYARATPPALRPLTSDNGATRVDHLTPPLSGAGEPPGARVSGASGQSGLPLFLLYALSAGLLAILTPCVFPLIPITLTSFVKQADGDKGKLFRLSTGYALGIVALFVLLGAVVSATLGATGANQLAANPWVNLVEFAIFVVFALSFFETISLRLPANLTALQAAGRKHGGLFGLVLLGITFVLASFTCTAPFVGTLLVAAAGGEKFRPLLGTLVFALAFVSPFLIFALFPQWIGRIPKSGLWLARAKATLGFIELAAALKFLSNADQVWQWKILTQPVLLAAWALIFVCAALYLLGTLRFGLVAELESSGQRVPAARRIVAGVFAALALYCFWGLAGRPLSPIVGAFLPPAGYGGAGAAANDGLPWLTDYPAALAQAKAENKPLLIDFTGYTCTNCRFNEKNVFPRAIVQNELGKYVRVQLYTDGGKDGPANQHFQESKFGDVTLPLYGIVNPGTETVVAKTGGLQSVDGFTQFLQRSQLVVNSQSTPSPMGRSGAVAPGQGVGSSPGGPIWSPYSPATVAQAAAQGKPSIIDFTASWCVNCKEIEHDVFANPAVAPILGRDFVTLRADLTQWNAPASAALEKQYGFAKLPTIIFLDKSGKEIRSLRITGRLGVADFQKRMQQASGITAPLSIASRRE